MKKVVFLIILYAVSVNLSAQTEPQFTQYMLNNSYFNPAAVGESELVQVAGMHKLLWLGMPNAGSTTIFQANMPVKLFGAKHGVGIKFKNDNVGAFFYQNVNLQFAYKRKFGEGVLSAGLDLGLVNAGFHGDSVYLPSQGNYHLPSDILLQGSEVNGIAFDMGVGLMYSTKAFYVSASYLSLTNPKISWTDTQDYQMYGNLYLTGGYSFKTYNPKIVLTPSFLFKSNFIANQLDVSCTGWYDERFWGGLNYRAGGTFGESIGVLGGVTILGGLSIGYAMDILMTKIGGWGSHEILLKYEFEFLGKNKHKHKSVRIL